MNHLVSLLVAALTSLIVGVALFGIPVLPLALAIVAGIPNFYITLRIFRNIERIREQDHILRLLEREREIIIHRLNSLRDSSPGRPV